ncbi:MAG: glutathione S-transferase family protein [Bradymonadaceae bacterium]
MGKLIEGQWRTETWLRDNTGHFKRDPTTFRHFVKSDGSTPFAPEAGRYHLYVSLACPWAHRTLIVRAMRGLEEAISVSVVHHFMGEDGWYFGECEGCTPDEVLGKKYLRDVYTEADSGYTGRVTVPILWDRKQGTIVNNESREIVRMFNTEFGELATTDLDLYPEPYQDVIDETIDAIYEPVNNGVYRAGFATTQEAYEEAYDELFGALDHWERELSNKRYLCGQAFTEADIFMFTTLLRFDPVYYSHFKCNKRRISDYPNLWNYLKEIYSLDGIAETSNLTHIKNHYYGSHETINPTRIVPKGPVLALDTPHDRERLPGEVHRFNR